MATENHIEEGDRAFAAFMGMSLIVLGGFAVTDTFRPVREVIVAATSSLRQLSGLDPTTDTKSGRIVDASTDISACLQPNANLVGLDQNEDGTFIVAARPVGSPINEVAIIDCLSRRLYEEHKPSMRIVISPAPLAG